MVIELWLNFYTDQRKQKLNDQLNSLFLTILSHNYY